MSFSTLLQSFGGFFSRSFWFSRFLPVVLIALAHELLGRWLVGWRFEAGIGGILKENMGNTLLTIAALIVFAYALSPLIPLIGTMLDGSILPEWLHNRLREVRRDVWVKSKRSPNSAYGIHIKLSDKRTEWKDSLRTAAETGIRGGTAADETTVAAASAEIAKFETIPRLRIAKVVDALDKAGAALCSALKSNSLNLKDVPLANQVNELNERFRGLIDELVNEAAHQLRAAESRLGVTDEEDFQPTRFGDARQLLQRYAKKTYEVPLHYIWPRVRLAILSGEEDTGTGTPRAVADGVAQVEFAIFLFALWWTIPLVWLPLIVARHGSIAPETAIWGFLAIGLAAPLVGKVLYELAVQAEIVAGRAIATALDRYRRDALKELGFDLPVTLSAERKLWVKLYRSSEPGIDLTYAKAAGAPQ